jgi:type I restriction enzyme S subunit
MSEGQFLSETKRRRFRPYPKYKDSGVEWIDNIPINWSVCPLFTVAREREEINFGNLVQDVLSLSYGKIIDRDVTDNFGLLPESYETYQIVHERNIILRLTDLQNDKRSLRVGLVNHPGIITSAYICLELFRDIEPSYSYYLLHAYDITKVFYSFGGGVRQTMKFEDLKWLPILKPSRDEQRTIASFLDRETAKIDALIEKKERLIELLQEKRAALITQAVTKGLDPTVPMKDSGVEWLGEIPAHWNVKRLKTVACLNTGGTPAGLLDEAFELEGVPWVKPDHLNGDRGIITPDRRLSPSAAKAAGIIKAGSSLVCGIGTVGKTGHAPFEVCTNQQINAITFGCEVTNRFGQFIVSCLTQEFMRHANKVTLAICNKSEMGEVSMCAPPLTEQRTIVSFLDRETAKVDALVAKIQEAIDRLKEYRTALISAAVTGKLDVRDVGSLQLNDES